MALFESGNPTLSESKFQKTITIDRSDVMTSKGTLNKFFFLFFMVMASAVFTWNAFNHGVNVFPWMIGAAIGGFILAIILAFKPHLGAYLAPPYGLLEGVFVGGISAIYSDAFAKVAPGIVMQAVALTFGTVIAMYILYRTGIIKATERFKSIVFTATAGIAIFYLIAIVLRMFSIDIPFLHEGSMVGILFSVFVVAIAALNLILDFDRIEQGVAMGAPKYMEWYGAFGLLVTIVWLYIEILRLLGKLNRK